MDTGVFCLFQFVKNIFLANKLLTLQTFNF